MATKPQQQDVNTRDDEKNDAQSTSRDSDSTGSLDSTLFLALIHTVITVSEHHRKKYENLRQQMVDLHKNNNNIEMN